MTYMVKLKYYLLQQVIYLKNYSEQDAVFAIMAALKQRSMDEMSTTGTGASFQAGAGAGYATPYAFKKKRKKD